jgi:hypothetical protein
MLDKSVSSSSNSVCDVLYFLLRVVNILFHLYHFIENVSTGRDEYSDIIATIADRSIPR